MKIKFIKSSNEELNVSFVFGGAGFIGAFFTKYLLDNGYVDKVAALKVQVQQFSKGNCS